MKIKRTSVDHLQAVLAETVFGYAADAKKASGRALGTLVEVITFYLLKAWGVHDSIAIERSLPEYRNPEICHNVEYSLHPSTTLATLQFVMDQLPISASKILKSLVSAGVEMQDAEHKSNQLVTSKRVLRNACTIVDQADEFLVATLRETHQKELTVDVRRLHRHPFAMVECKRVGVEEGNKKGPQTIEKAKQGAYVARSVSSLQKVRLKSGEIGGVVNASDGTILCRPYDEFLKDICSSTDYDLLSEFTLTIGIVSNHGNWFTSDNHNKELKVLAQSYDWLVFLTDRGLAQFINNLIMSPSPPHVAVRDAFLASYTGKSGKNKFTKVQMDLEADLVLREYFQENTVRIEEWFNVIAPKGRSISILKQELEALYAKPWNEIYA